MKTKLRTDTISLRVSADLKRRIEEVALSQHKSVSQVVIDATIMALGSQGNNVRTCKH